MHSVVKPLVFLLFAWSTTTSSGASICDISICDILAIPYKSTASAVGCTGYSMIFVGLGIWGTVVTPTHVVVNYSCSEGQIMVCCVNATTPVSCIPVEEPDQCSFPNVTACLLNDTEVVPAEPHLGDSTAHAFSIISLAYGGVFTLYALIALVYHFYVSYRASKAAFHLDDFDHVDE